MKRCEMTDLEHIAMKFKLEESLLHQKFVRRTRSSYSLSRVLPTSNSLQQRFLLLPLQRVFKGKREGQVPRRLPEASGTSADRRRPPRLPRLDHPGRGPGGRAHRQPSVQRQWNDRLDFFPPDVPILGNGRYCRRCLKEDEGGLIY